MANTTLMKVMIIFLCINILLFLGGVRVIDTNEDFMNTFLGSNGQNNSISGSEFYNTTEGLKTTSSQGIGTTITNFVDALNAVKAFIVLLVNLLLTPIGLFATMPQTVGLVIGIPMTVIGILGLIYFIRSGG